MIMIITSAERKVKDSHSSRSECSKVASECPEVASELVRGIFEFFDFFFLGERSNYEKVLLLEEIKV